MDKDSIITIFTPTNGHNCGAGEKEKGEIGTGYPVGEELILTSRHVVSPKNRDTSKPIRVRWHYLASDEDGENGWISLEQEPVWVGKGDMDVALLRCPRPEKARGRMPGNVAVGKPPSGQRWESTGFPRATKRDDGTRDPDEFSGTTESMADNARYFVVLLKSPPRKRELMKGASGMPVFINDVIYGVVRAAPTNFDGDKLTVVPTWLMLNDEKFLEHLGLNKRKEFLDHTRKALLRILEADASGKVVMILAEILGLAINTSGLESRIIVKLVEETEIENFFSVVARARKKLIELNDSGSVVLLSQIVRYILPLLIDPVTVENIRRHKVDATIGLIGLPAFSRTVAEIIMAGTDRREVRYRPLTGDKDWLDMEGVASLQVLPEAGRNHTGEQSIKDLRTHLSNELEPVASDQFFLVFSEYMKKRFIRGRDRDRVLKQKEKIIDQYIGVMLKNEAEQNNLTYYFLVESLDDVQQSDRQRELMRKLKRKFSFVAFLELSDDPVRMLNETELYSPLRDIIY